MPIAIIVAAAGKDRVIGKDGDLPWHFACDLKFFKETTTGHAVLMGRVTYQSILKRLGKPLPGRRNLVLTRDPTFVDARVELVRDIEKIRAIPRPQEWLFIIGGAKIYEQTLPLADVLYVTHIDQEIAGDAFFPPIDPAIWKLTNERIETEKGVTLRFCTYERDLIA